MARATSNEAAACMHTILYIHATLLHRATSNDGSCYKQRGCPYDLPMTHRTCECQVLPCCCSPAHVLPCSCSLCSPAVEPPASLTLPLLTLFHLRCRSADACHADGLLRLLRLVFPSPRRLLLCCPPSSVSDRPPWSNPQPLSILLQAPPWQHLGLNP